MKTMQAIRIGNALRRARQPILWMVAANLLGVFTGMAMVHLGYAPAIAFEERLVQHTEETSSITANLEHGNRIHAALLDAGGNLCLGALPNTVMGLSVVLPFPMAAFRGWIGGIVSINVDEHGRRTSRLVGREGLYYWPVLLMQILPYALTGGAGVRLGLGFVLPASRWGYRGRQWLRLPVEGLKDVGWIYLLALPLFLLASLVEFVCR